MKKVYVNYRHIDGMNALFLAGPTENPKTRHAANQLPYIRIKFCIPTNQRTVWALQLYCLH